jgi:dipeptidyl aminopeptidase/acylaminoacyl peptidase
MIRSTANKVMWVGRSTGFYALVVAVLLALGLIGAVVAATDPAKAAFPGHNGKIAFASNRDGNWEIYTMNSDGTSQQNLTFSWSSDLRPAWSANGKQIAFDSFRDGNEEVYRMSTSGALQTRLTFNVAVDSRPSWQPLP